MTSNYPHMVFLLRLCRLGAVFSCFLVVMYILNISQINETFFFLKLLLKASQRYKEAKNALKHLD